VEGDKEEDYEAAVIFVFVVQHVPVALSLLMAQLVTGNKEKVVLITTSTVVCMVQMLKHTD